MKSLKLGLVVALVFLTRGQALGSISNHDTLVELKTKITDAKAKILEAEIKKRGILAVLYDINKDLGKTNSEINNLEEQMTASKRKIEGQSAVVAKLEKEKESQKRKLSLRLRALYKMGAQGYAQVLLSSQSSTELSRNVRFMSLIAKNDADLLITYKKNIEETLVEQAKLRAQVRTYIITEKKLKSEKEKFNQQRESQNYLLASVEKDKSHHLQALKEWREAGSQFEEKLKSLEKTDSSFKEVTEETFFEKQGQLQVPVSGEILQRYGIFTDTRFDTKMFHKGLFFAARPGDDVAALYNGKVVHSGWVNGFGETIILDHGDHYYSVYAHCSALLKKPGETVKSGEVIAKSGDTGSLRGPGLYFEIRHFSESLDPMAWLDLKSNARL